MLAAEFHYNRRYCDREMDLDDFITHITYHQNNPPAGAVLQGLIKAFFGNKDEESDSGQKTFKPSTIFTKEVKEKLEGMSMDEKFEYLSTLPLTKDQMAERGKSLDSFMDDFGAVGGSVR